MLATIVGEKYSYNQYLQSDLQFVKHLYILVYIMFSGFLKSTHFRAMQCS